MSSLEDKEPLAYSARPKDLDGFKGQRELLAEGSIVSRVLETGILPTSLIFTGPPGVGKSTLAKLLAVRVASELRSINATTSSISEIREIIDYARKLPSGLVLLIDEIHRFNKTQQDALLKASEEGEIKIIGTTTENPFFAVNKALLSRSHILRFSPLTPQELRSILDETLTKQYPKSTFEEEALDILSKNCGGDARRALNILNYLIMKNDKITTSDLTTFLGSSTLLFDKNGEQHYNLISALIKSVRGSDPDSSLLYLSSCLDSGMDPLYVARRLVVLASEDIGLADPSALSSALNAYRVVEVIGLPEARYALVQATLHLSLAYKSNSVSVALAKSAELSSRGPLIIPPHLRDSHYSGSTRMGVLGYEYPHDLPGGISSQNYWPENLGRVTFYKPNSRGNEVRIKELLEKIKSVLGSKE